MSADDRFLIVNADDFGRAEGINRGIARAHEQGIVTSASLMVRYPAAEAAAAYARARPELSVGLHVDLGEWIYADGEWRQVETVVGGGGRDAVERGVARQLGRFRRLLGREPTHLDSHQHVHLDEPLASVLGELADVLGIPLRHRSPLVRYCGDFYGQGRRGEPLPDLIEPDALVSIVERLEPGWTELGCHPGELDGLESSYLDQRVAEIAALCDPRVETALRAAGVELRSFHELPRRRRRRAPATIRPAVTPDPVFVIGCPRSGTSVLAWSLAQHPDFWTSHETDFLAELLGGGHAEQAYAHSTGRAETWLRHHHVDRAEFLCHVGLGLNALLTSRSEGRRWVDQTPRYTLLAATLAEAFPGARFLHIVRDGRAVVHSMLHFGDSLGSSLAERAALPHWARSFEEAVATWCRYVEAALDFAAAEPERTLTVANERLVTCPEEGFAQILAFLDAPPDPSPAAFFASSRINSSFQPPVWGSGHRPPPPRPAAADPRGEWTPAQHELFTTAAGALMARCGFGSL